MDTCMGDQPSSHEYQGSASLFCRSVPSVESSGIWAPGLACPSASPSAERGQTGFANGRRKCMKDAVDITHSSLHACQ